MKQLSGKCISEGSAMGRVCRFVKEKNKKAEKGTPQASLELSRYEEARSKVLGELAGLQSDGAQAGGSFCGVDILDGYISVLQDPEFNEFVYTKIKNENMFASRAVCEAGQVYSDLLLATGDEYICERAMDVRDVAERIEAAITGTENTGVVLTKPSIIFADELSAADIMGMDAQMLLGIIVNVGGRNSHLGILARAMKIPAVSGVSDKDMYECESCILDAEKGSVLLEPEDKQVSLYQEGLWGQSMEDNTAEAAIDSVSIDDFPIRLCANVGKLEEINESVIDSDGIGLFRSEFLFFGQSSMPSEEKQFEVYKQAAMLLNDKPVVIRTADIGGDKQVDFLPYLEERNPALGLRAIRLYNREPELIATQLRAIYRASTYGSLSIMYPMVTSLDEVLWLKDLSRNVREDLRKDGIEYRQIPEGVMIETPAAALISDELAKCVDFFSIGTNDLMQYTLAADRQNPYLEGMYDTLHPALYRLIEMTIKNAHAAGIECSICGELGSDLKQLGSVLKLGVDSLSVSPVMLSAIRGSIYKYFNHTGL